MLAAGAQQPSPGGSMISSLLIMLPLFAIMYFLWIRPQQKKQKEHDELLTKLKAGDKVMTTSGIIATVVKVAEKRVTLEIAPKVNVDFVQGAIANIFTDDTTAAQDSKNAPVHTQPQK